MDIAHGSRFCLESKIKDKHTVFLVTYLNVITRTVMLT